MAVKRFKDELASVMAMQSAAVLDRSALVLPLDERAEVLHGGSVPLRLQRRAEALPTRERLYRPVLGALQLPQAKSQALHLQHVLQAGSIRISQAHPHRPRAEEALQATFKLKSRHAISLDRGQALSEPSRFPTLRQCMFVLEQTSEHHHLCHRLRSQNQLALKSSEALPMSRILPFGFHLSLSTALPKRFHTCYRHHARGDFRARCLLHRQALPQALYGAYGGSWLPKLQPSQPSAAAPTWRCGTPPVPAALSLALQRLNVYPHSAHLPLPFNCGQATPHPKQGAYLLMHHVLSAQIDDFKVSPLSLLLRHGMDGFCWQVQLDLPAADFQNIRMDERPPGQEALLSLNLNGELWRFILEDYRDERRHAAHGGHRFSVSGRSITARLGADYARSQQGIIQGARYARQIANEQLQFLPFKIRHWQIEDWLVPAQSYAITGKTTLAVLGDIAQAAGAYLESHPSEALLDVKPRWKKPAWALDQADQIVYARSILSISGQRLHQPHANAVRLIPAGGGSGGHVFRQGSDALPALPDLRHPLYSDLPVWRSAGIAALSDSGLHKIETLELPFHPKHQALAQLGDIWEVQENENWRGIVQAVSLKLQCSTNGALKIRQLVELNRYLGN